MTVFVGRGAVFAALLGLAACGQAETVVDAAIAPDATAETVAAETPDPVAPQTSSVDDLLAATVIRWSVVGDFDDEVLILNVSTSGYARVTDHVEFAYDFTLEGNGGLTGTPTFANFPSSMGALRNGADGCRAPTVSAPPYEHWTIEKIEAGIGAAVALTVRTNYPEGQVPVACSGGNQTSAARVEVEEVQLPIPGIALLMMGDQLTGDVRLSADRRSVVHKDGGWTFVSTPSKVR